MDNERVNPTWSIIISLKMHRPSTFDKDAPPLQFRWRCSTPPLLLEMHHPTTFVGDAPSHHFYWRCTTPPLLLEMHHPHHFCWRCTTPPLSLEMHHPKTFIGDAPPLHFRKIYSQTSVRHCRVKFHFSS